MNLFRCIILKLCFSLVTLTHATREQEIVADFLNIQNPIRPADYSFGLAQMKQIMQNPGLFDDDHIQRFLGVVQAPEIFIRPGWLTDPVVPADDAGFFTQLQEMRTKHILGLNRTQDDQTVLNLSSKQIQRLAPYLFQNLRDVRMISLDNNDLPMLPGTLFQGLTDLQEIDLRNNKLQELPENLFQGLTDLQEINLESNKLQELSEKLFHGLTYLQAILLYNNKLQRLPANLFHGLTALGFLDLRNNKLQELSEKLFHGLTALGVIDLRNNKLQELSDKLFDGLTALGVIDLGNNQLWSVPENLFHGLTALEGIHLDGNNLQELPAKLFLGLTALQFIFLGHNNLQELLGNLFQGLTALKEIHLDNNELRTLPSSLASLQRSLTLLSAEDNPLFLASDIPEQYGIAEMREALRDRFSFSNPEPWMATPHLDATERSVTDLQNAFGEGLKSCQLIFPQMQLVNHEKVITWWEDVERVWVKPNDETVAALSEERLSTYEDLRIHLKGYLQKLFDLSEDFPHISCWIPKGANKQALQKALAFILYHLTCRTDLVDGSMMQLWPSLLNCPTGQWKAAEVLIHSFYEVGEGKKEPLDKLKMWVARQKESYFRRAVLSQGGVNNGQNVHLLAHYHESLEEPLGLTASSYRDPLNVMGLDPFESNPWCVATLYYETVRDYIIGDLIQLSQGQDLSVSQIDLMAALNGEVSWWTANPMDDDKAYLTEIGAREVLYRMNIIIPRAANL